MTGKTTLVGLLFAATLSLAVAAVHTEQAAVGGVEVVGDYLELLEKSKAEKHGLVFFLNGNKVTGIVRHISGDRVVEVYSREFDRIVIRLEHVLAIAKN